MSLFEPKPITMADLKEIEQSDIRDFLESRGCSSIRCFQYRDCVIITSIDPSGANGEREIHVSVSRNGKPCDMALASQIGKAIYPHVSGWDYMGKEREAFHLFSSEVPK